MYEATKLVAFFVQNRNRMPGFEDDLRRIAMLLIS